MGFIHYSHDYVWSSLTQQERRTVKYLRDMVTGLTFKPRPVEFQRGRIGLQKKRDIFSLWEQFKTPTQCVVTYKEGTLEKTFLTQLKIPFVNLEEYGCPKLDYLPDTYYPLVNCGCHFNLSFHCSMAECNAFMRWFNKNTQ